MPTTEACETTTTYQIQVGGAELIQPIAGQWLELCRRQEKPTPFNNPFFIEAHLNAFAPGQQLVLATAYRGDQLQAVVPLIEERTSFCGLPVRKLRGAANANSAKFDIAVAPGKDGEQAIDEIWRMLRERKTWDVIEMPFVPSGGSAEQLLKAADKEGYATGQYPASRSPFISIENSGECTAKSHFLRNLRRRMRKAAEKVGPLRLTVSRGDFTDLQQFYELESSGWKGEKGTAIASSEATRRFFDHVATDPAIHSEIYTLYFGETPVAGKLSLVCDHRMYNLKCGYDEKFREYGPGHILMELALKELVKREIREFDFCGAWMEWKAEWTPLVRNHSFCYIFRKGVYGYCLYSAKLKIMATAQRIARDPRVGAFRKWLARR